MRSDATTRRSMRQHILKLAKANDIRLHWIRDWTKAESYPEERSAFVPRIDAGSDYLICLHELGHILSNEAAVRTGSTDTYNWVLCEGAAWAWASSAAKKRLSRTLSKKDWRVVASAFESHVIWAAVTSQEVRLTPELLSSEMATRPTQNSSRGT